MDYNYYEIISMDDATFLDLVNDYYIRSKEINLDNNEIISNLSEKGIEFNVVDVKQNKSSVSTDIELNITTSKRSGQSYTYVTGIATATKALTDTGTEDMMSIEWNPSKGEYYGYTETQNATLKSYAKKDQGCLVFNIQDYKFTAKGNYALCSAKVNFGINSSKGYLGLTYIHTYTSYAPTLTIGGNVSFQKNTATGGLSLGLSATQVSNVWERAYLADYN